MIKSPRYRIFFFEGERLSNSDVVEGGTAAFDKQALLIEANGRKLIVRPEDMETPILYRQGGSMHVIKLKYGSGCLHLAVVRLLIRGRFAIVNAIATRRLYKMLEAAVGAAK